MVFSIFRRVERIYYININKSGFINYLIVIDDLYILVLFFIIFRNIDVIIFILYVEMCEVKRE